MSDERRAEIEAWTCRCGHITTAGRCEDCGRLRDARGDDEAALPAREVLAALNAAYHPQNPTRMHPADYITLHFKLDGYEGLRDVR